MRFNNILPELAVIDFEKSLHFYTEILGFKLEYSRTDPLFAFLSYQGSQLMIQQDDGNEDDDWSTGKREYPLGRGINFQLETDDIQKIVDSLTKNNYPLKRGVEESWYKVKKTLHGHREILVMDPSGYLLRFSQYLGTKRAT